MTVSLTLGLTLSLTVGLIATGCSGGQAHASATTAASAAGRGDSTTRALQTRKSGRSAGKDKRLPAAELAKRCLILTTNDSESHFDGRKHGQPPNLRYEGTISRVAAEKLRQLHKRRGAVLLVSAGDVLQGRYMARKDGDRKRAARDAWRIYEQAGYDVGVLGNHEFDAGPKVLRYALAGLTTYRMVVSNLDPNSPSLHNREGKIYANTLIRRCGGLRIGFFGLLTPSTRNISKFGDTRFSDPDDPVYAPARRAIAKLRKARVDVVVGLTHLGYRHDRKLAQTLRGIDLIIGGHSHTLLKEWKRVGETLVVQSGSRFGHLGYVDIVGRPGGGIIAGRSSWRVRRIDEDMPRDDAVARAIDDLRGGFAKEHIVGERSQAWVLRGAGRAPYGRRVARAVTLHISQRHHVDGALLNMGGLRTSTTYPAGPVTDQEIRAIHPFGNRLVRVELTGKQLRQLLEHACTKGHRGKLGGRVALYGVTMRCDGARERLRYKRLKGKVVGISVPGQRVQDLRVGGAEVDLKKTYIIATNDYLARGGSGFWYMTQLKRRCGDDRDFTIDHCKGAPTLAEVVERAVRAGTFDRPL